MVVVLNSDDLFHQLLKAISENDLELRRVVRKKIPWWNHDSKEAIRAKTMLSKSCSKTGHHLICNSRIPGAYSRSSRKRAFTNESVEDEIFVENQKNYNA